MSGALGVACGLLAAALVMLGTRAPGPGISMDSVYYLSAAESFARHGTLQVTPLDWRMPEDGVPLVTFPPGFPIAVSGLIRVGVDPLLAARIVNALSASIAVGVAVWLAGAAAGLGAGALAAIGIGLTSAIAASHVVVLSEPLFMAALVVTLACMVWRPSQPLLAGTAAAVAVATRYAGVACVGAAVLWVLVADAPWRFRLRNAVLAALPGSAVCIAWVLRSRHAAPDEPIRTLQLQGGLGGFLSAGFVSVGEWLTPVVGWYYSDAAYRALALAIVVLAIGLVAVPTVYGLARASQEDAKPGATLRLLTATAILAAIYAAVLLLSKLFADTYLLLERRILAPFFLLVVVAFAVILAEWWRAPRRPRLLRATVATATLAWAVLSLAETRRVTEELSRTGIELQGSPLVTWARAQRPGYALFSNRPEAIVLFARRPARQVPSSPEPPGTGPQSLDTAIARAFGETLVRRGGAMIGFRSPNVYMMSPDSLAKFLGLREVARFDDGVVWAPTDDARVRHGDVSDARR